jgi:hypothetical protein
MERFRLTRHAERRCQQRGFRSVQLTAFREIADLCVPVGRGLSALRCSRDALREAVSDGMAPADADRFAGRVMILADDGAVVTVAHLHGRKAWTYRRRDRRPFWRD